MPTIKEVNIVNDHLEVVIEDLDLGGEKTPDNLRNFVLHGAGDDPKRGMVMKVEWEKNPNHSGVLFLDIDQAELDRILRVRDELLLRDPRLKEKFEEGGDLCLLHPVKLKGDRADFDPTDPNYHRTSDIKEEAEGK